VVCEDDGGEDVGASDGPTQGIEGGKVDGGSEASAEGAGKSAAPEGEDTVSRGGDGTDGSEEGERVGLLHAGFEEVGWLEEDGGDDTGT
jgi:hypothetical protein